MLFSHLTAQPHEYTSYGHRCLASRHRRNRWTPLRFIYILTLAQIMVCPNWDYVDTYVMNMLATSCDRGSGRHAQLRDRVANVALYITAGSKPRSQFWPIIYQPRVGPISMKLRILIYNIDLAYPNRMPLSASQNSWWFQDYWLVKFAILSRT